MYHWAGDGCGPLGIDLSGDAWGACIERMWLRFVSPNNGKLGAFIYILLLPIKGLSVRTLIWLSRADWAIFQGFWEYLATENQRGPADVWGGVFGSLQGHYPPQLAKIRGSWGSVVWGTQRVCYSGERTPALLFNRSSRSSYIAGGISRANSILSRRVSVCSTELAVERRDIQKSKGDQLKGLLFTCLLSWLSSQPFYWSHLSLCQARPVKIRYWYEVLGYPNCKMCLPSEIERK